MSPLRVLVIGAGIGGISVARGLVRAGHDVTVFERMSALRSGGGAVTIWPNGASVLDQLGVDMTDAGQELSTLRVTTSTGRRVSTLDIAGISSALGAPTRMVPRRTLFDRLLDGFPAERIRCDSRVISVQQADGHVCVDFDDGTSAEGDVVIGADGRHSIVRRIIGAKEAEPTGWCSWQGLISLPDIAASRDAAIIIGAQGNLGLWPAGGGYLQWWFDLPWSVDFSRPDRPIELLRSQFTGWSEASDRVLDALTDEHLAPSPFPHFRHPIPRNWGEGHVTLLGDAAHVMPPTLAQGSNQALLDTMILCRALSAEQDLPRALRAYARARRRKVAVVSRLTALQMAHAEAALRPAAIVPDSVTTWAMARFLRSVSYPTTTARTDIGLTT